ncbi:hypothetical protein BwSH20_77120 [Bradyrhizobium ottawaense]|nr:hypothetical protein BwSH12_77160 [Bradyrhizobium ottawaense]GMO11352.1 hypothetical protein BwSH20_77120 [Bradyrhizobium ottawaense]GMO11869.1 hypothetical protein BwSF19_77250 [Bradyrhizobium ottawaense]GMO39236.1 hypothetical protein BwSH14_49070 [Bradyrhizobium ottawaense]GMO49542.1 hypothetical protein BwSF21_69820 [Bradyrhizobium ottawaense]
MDLNVTHLVAATDDRFSGQMPKGSLKSLNETATDASHPLSQRVDDGEDNCLRVG